jgi:hypothetical protein
MKMFTFILSFITTLSPQRFPPHDIFIRFDTKDHRSTFALNYTVEGNVYFKN